MPASPVPRVNLAAVISLVKRSLQYASPGCLRIKFPTIELTFNTLNNTSPANQVFDKDTTYCPGIKNNKKR